MRRAREGQIVDAVHFLRRQRNGRRRQPHVPVAMSLRQRAGVAGIALPVQHARGAGIGFRIAGNLLEGRQADDDFSSFSVALSPPAFVRIVEIVGGGFEPSLLGVATRIRARPRMSEKSCLSPLLAMRWATSTKARSALP